MLWTWPGTRYGNMWTDVDRLQREMNRLFEPFTRSTAKGQDNFPAVNIWASEDDVLLTAELPGVDPAAIDVTVKEDTVTVRGTRQEDKLGEGESYLRRERGVGTFVRSFSLPYHVDSGKVTALYQTGILQLRLPRAEADKPKKIQIKAG